MANAHMSVPNQCFWDSIQFNRLFKHSLCVFNRAHRPMAPCDD